MAEGWDDEDFDVDAGFVKDDDSRWEGEDEAIQEKLKAVEVLQEADTTSEKTKKSKTERIEEKKAERRAKELEEKEEAVKTEKIALTADEEYALKMSLLRLEKESDLKLMKELMGTSESGGIDGMFPTNKEEFDKFEGAVSKKILGFQTSSHYVGLLDNMLRSLTAGLEPEDIRRLSANLSTLAQEKSKLLSKSKPKKKGAKLAGLGKSAKRIGNLGVDEFDDFTDTAVVSLSKGSDLLDDNFM